MKQCFVDGVVVVHGVGGEDFRVFVKCDKQQFNVQVFNHINPFT